MGPTTCASITSSQVWLKVAGPGITLRETLTWKNRVQNKTSWWPVAESIEDRLWDSFFNRAPDTCAGYWRTETGEQHRQIFTLTELRENWYLCIYIVSSGFFIFWSHLYIVTVLTHNHGHSGLVKHIMDISPRYTTLHIPGSVKEENMCYNKFD